MAGKRHSWQKISPLLWEGNRAVCVDCDLKKSSSRMRTDYEWPDGRVETNIPTPPCVRIEVGGAPDA